MPSALIAETVTVAKHKPKSSKPIEHADGYKERVDFTAEPEWIAELEAAADALGLSRAAYIRMACNRLMASDKKQSDA